MQLRRKTLDFHNEYLIGYLTKDFRDWCGPESRESISADWQQDLTATTPADGPPR